MRDEYKAKSSLKAGCGCPARPGSRRDMGIQRNSRAALVRVVELDVPNPRIFGGAGPIIGAARNYFVTATACPALIRKPMDVQARCQKSTYQKILASPVFSSKCPSIKCWESNE